MDVIYNTDDDSFYLISNQDLWLIKVENEAQLKMLSHCFFPKRLNKTGITSLLNNPKYKYYKSVDAFIEAEYENMI